MMSHLAVVGPQFAGNAGARACAFARAAQYGTLEDGVEPLQNPRRGLCLCEPDRLENAYNFGGGDLADRTFPIFGNT